MNLKEVKQLLNRHELYAKKHYGQNFLVDPNILQNIVTNAHIDETSLVIEIGPGLGALTEKLANTAKRVLCYEIDRDMIDILHQRLGDTPNLVILHQDVLTANINHDIEQYLEQGAVSVVANLPYYITTAILLKLLEECSYIKSMIVMMQKEVAQRICGKPSTKDYNSLSVLIQFFTKPRLLFSVMPHAFYPEPTVESSVVMLEYQTEMQDKVLHLPYFFKMNRTIFAARRKTLVNNIVAGFAYPKEAVIQVLGTLGISATARAESLSVEKIIELANTFYTIF